jgi:hypothetical protein
MPAATRAAADKGQSKDLFTESFLKSEKAVKMMAEEAEAAGGPLVAGREQVRESLERVSERAAGWNEKALRTRLIEPVLDALGWKGCHYPEPPVDIKPHAKFADYALFANAEACQDGIRDSKMVPGAKVLAWMEAEPWRQEFGESRVEKRPKRVIHPEAQIRDYILLPQSQWPVKWGILTNGRVWRLYHHKTVPRAYYEINLEAAVGDEELWRRFFLFFRREGLADGGFLERLLEENERARTELSKHLKNAVYDALEQVAQGFLDHPDNRLIRDDATLEEIRWGSFILLYRLLFILFGEYHGLLPRDNPAYRLHSLEKMIEEIGEREPERPALGTQRVSARWDALRRLFDTINRGDKAMGVPEYNGTLFEKEALGPRLLDDAAIKIADGWVERALWFLTRDQNGKRLDFGELGSRDVALRELGSVYEGLLEQQVRCAGEDMVWVRIEKGKKGEKALTHAEAKEHDQSRWGKAIPAGTVYLETSRGERKATGSYFTPGYIVDYIVEQTVGPLADEAAKKVEGERKRVDRELANLRRRAKGKPDSHDDAKKLKQREKEAPLEVLEPYLSLMVLDPAMGSGHFLVGAGDFLTDRILGDPNRMPPATNGAEGERAAVRRVVVERCLYGVDLNPLAVELAKLSLWIWSAQRDRPLCFLDHHLRCGNSLIGARLADLGQPPVMSKARGRSGASPLHSAPSPYPSPTEGGGKVKGQVVTPVLPFGERLEHDMRYAVEQVWWIEHAPSDNARAVHEKEEILRTKIEPERLRYKRLADLWCAFWFLEPLRRERKPAVPLGPGDFLAVRDSITSGTEKGLPKDLVRRLKRVDEIARDKHFFHWELEFPEVFFDHSGKPLENPGFDAVIGNPPWLGVRTGEIEPRLTEFVRSQGRAFGQFDIAALFLEDACERAQRGGWVGMVVPKRIGTNETYSTLREHLVVSRRLTAAVDLGVAFEGVDNDVLTLVSGPQSADRLCVFGKRLGGETLAFWDVPSDLARRIPFHILPLNSEPAAAVLAAHITEANIVGLGHLCSIVRGAECGMNHPAVTREAGPGVLALLDHLDVDRYHVAPSGWYLDASRIAASAMKSPSLYRRVPKLLVRFLSARLVVALDETGYASTNLLYHLHPTADARFLCAVLSSAVLSFWYQTTFQNEEIKFPHVQKSHLERLPIRRIALTTPKGERERLAREGKGLCEGWVAAWGPSAPLRTTGGARKGEILRFAQNDKGEAGGAALRPYGDFLRSPVGRWLEKRLPNKANGSPDSEKEQSDVVHDLLAHLAEQMIEMNKQKQAEVKRFLGWLEREIKRPVDELKQKTKIKDYHKGSFEGLLDALRANDAALGRIASRSFFQEDLRREFEESVGVLTPLKERIGATDRLIDLVVYRLYGLTEEDVEVVEGRTER